MAVKRILAHAGANPDKITDHTNLGVQKRFMTQSLSVNA